MDFFYSESISRQEENCCQEQSWCCRFWYLRVGISAVIKSSSHHWFVSEGPRGSERPQPWTCLRLGFLLRKCTFFSVEMKQTSNEANKKHSDKILKCHKVQFQTVSDINRSLSWPLNNIYQPPQFLYYYVQFNLFQWTCTLGIPQELIRRRWATDRSSSKLMALAFRLGKKDVGSQSMGFHDVSTLCFIIFHYVSHYVLWCFSVYSVMFGALENSKLALNGKTSPSLLRFHSSSCRQYPLMTSTCLLRGKRPGFDLTSPVHVQTLHDWYSFFYWRNWEGFHTNFITFLNHSWWNFQEVANVYAKNALMQTRGNAGTHDVQLGTQTIKASQHRWSFCNFLVCGSVIQSERGRSFFL